MSCYARKVITGKRTGIQNEPFNKFDVREEDAATNMLARRGEHAGLVHVISAMEASESFRPWHGKNSANFAETVLSRPSGLF